MRITLDDLNGRVAASFREKVRALLEEESPETGCLSAAERHARTLLRQETAAKVPGRTGSVFPLIASLLLVGSYASFYFDANVPAVVVPVALSSLGVLTIGQVVLIGRETRSQQRHYPPEVMQAVFSLVLRTRAEGIYRDILLLLADRDMPLDDQAARDILRQLNLLLENRFRLETQRRKVGSLLAATSLSQLEAERAELGRKAAQTQDAVAGETLQESVDLCERRLQHARALLPMLERLDAQQEVIHQALATVHSALVRLQAASLTLAAVSVSDITETVHRIDAQTRAVEQAVEEVMTLRVGQ